MREAFLRAGYQAVLCTRPDEAASVLAAQKVNYIFCDCMLPQMTGVDFIVKTRENFPNVKFKAILMSGIYTDKAFIQDAIRQTEAIAFLSKPFDLGRALSLVTVGDERSKPREEGNANARKALYQMFANPSATSRQKRKIIESIEEISGFDLPFIYSLLVESKSSGYLNLYHNNGSVSGVSFCEGDIIGVDIEDKTTYIGEMLIQNGYALPEDVQQALKSQNQRRVGQELVQSNQLSPHAFDLMLAQQMNVRLSKTITDEKLKINFASAEVERISPHLDAEDLLEFLHDWIASKIPVSWLKSLYMMWSGYVIVPSPTADKNSRAYSMQLPRSLDGFAQRLSAKLTLSQLLDLPGYNEKSVYKAIHFLLTKGLILFEQKSSFASAEEQLLAVRKIATEIQGRNDFEIMAYMEAATLSEDSVVDDFVALLGPMPQDSRSEFYKTWSQVKNRVEEAARASSDQMQRTQFREASARTEAEGKLKANQLMEEVKQALQLNQFAKAQTMLTEIAKLHPEIPQFHLFAAWTKVGLMDPNKKQPLLLKEVELEMMQIPPDERYDSLFPFVVGLFNRSKGDLMGARKSFEKSMALDPSFIVARRELNLLGSHNKKQDILNMDLKDMVSGFFKKR